MRKELAARREIDRKQMNWECTHRKYSDPIRPPLVINGEKIAAV